MQTDPYLVKAREAANHILDATRIETGVSLESEITAALLRARADGSENASLDPDWDESRILRLRALADRE